MVTHTNIHIYNHHLPLNVCTVLHKIHSLAEAIDGILYSEAMLLWSMMCCAHHLLGMFLLLSTGSFYGLASLHIS